MANERLTTAKADAPSGIRNTRLLLVAGGLGVVVVILYLAQIAHIHQGYDQGKVKLLMFTHDVPAGTVVSEKDVERVEVERSQLGRMGDLVVEKDFGQVYGQPSADDGKKGQYLQYRHITLQERERPANRIVKGMVAFPLDVDPHYVPGDVLRVYDRVLVMAVLVGKDRRARTYPVFKGAVRVIAIGGRGEQVRELRSGGQRVGEVASSYRTVTIEVPDKELPELINLLTHKVGSVRLALPSSENTPTEDAASINPALKDLATSAESPVGYQPLGG
ncbi:MAG: RcpC/CpaB family pilus assembly protein [Planctomycetaceae bacterium]|nr:RcpC/CpaB family pilus assembly protein [Planctomycetaceae bacterium]